MVVMTMSSYTKYNFCKAIKSINNVYNNVTSCQLCDFPPKYAFPQYHPLIRILEYGLAISWKLANEFPDKFK